VVDCEKGAPAMRAYAMMMKSQEFVLFKHRPAFQATPLICMNLPFLLSLL